MLFRISDFSKSNNKLPVFRLKAFARRFVILSKKQAADIEVNTYLVKNKKIDLITACLRIINKAQYSFNLDGDLIITIIDKKLDELASIINFGTGKVHGTNILKRAFAQM